MTGGGTVWLLLLLPACQCLEAFPGVSPSWENLSEISRAVILVQIVFSRGILTLRLYFRWAYFQYKFHTNKNTDVDFQLGLC